VGVVTDPQKRQGWPVTVETVTVALLLVALILGVCGLCTWALVHG
jgi:hypothetical protein